MKNLEVFEIQICWNLWRRQLLIRIHHIRTRVIILLLMKWKEIQMHKRIRLLPRVRICLKFQFRQLCSLSKRKSRTKQRRTMEGRFKNWRSLANPIWMMAIDSLMIIRHSTLVLANSSRLKSGRRSKEDLRQNQVARPLPLYPSLMKINLANGRILRLLTLRNGTQLSLKLNLFRNTKYWKNKRINWRL